MLWWCLGDALLVLGLVSWESVVVPYLWSWLFRCIDYAQAFEYTIWPSAKIFKCFVLKGLYAFCLDIEFVL